MLDKNNKGFLQKRHWRSSTARRKVWWLDHCRSQRPQRGRWIQRRSPVRCRGTRSCQSYPCKTKSSHETEKRLSKFLEPPQAPKVAYTDNSMEFGKACEILSWNHRTSTPHRSETNGIAERAVRRVKEGTSAVLLQSGLNESWWADSMECYTCLRNVTDLFSDGKTPYERRFWQPFKGPIIPFCSLVKYHPITAKDQSRIHQFGKKVLPGIFLGYELIVGGSWKGNILTADLEYLEKLDASDFYPPRINAKEVLISQKMTNSYSQLQMVQQNCQEETTNSEYPLQSGNHREEWRTRWRNSRRIGRVSTSRSNRWRWSLPISGRSKVTSSVVVTMNPEFNSMCREKKHSLFHWNTLMLQGPLTLIWTSRKKRNVSMIIGMSIRTRRLSDTWKGFTKFTLLRRKSLPKDICGSRRRLTKVQTDCQTTSRVARSMDEKTVKPLRIEKNKNGKKRVAKTRQCSEDLRGIHFHRSGIWWI